MVAKLGDPEAMSLVIGPLCCIYLFLFCLVVFYFVWGEEVIRFTYLLIYLDGGTGD